MSEQLATIATFSLAIEADVAKSKLESEGIECFLADDNTVTMNWLYSNAVGGVKLKVRETDAQRAVEILRQSSPAAEGVEHQSDQSINHVAEDNETRCPRCDSTNVHYEKFSRRLAFASWLIFSFPLPFLKRKWKCGNCGHQWKGSEKPLFRT